MFDNHDGSCIRTAALTIFVVACLCIPARALAQDETSLIAAQVFDQVDRMAAEMGSAVDAYQKAKEAGDAEAIEQAERQMKQAEVALAKAEGKLDAARIAALAKAGGVPEAKVTAMRDSGMGWGVIAKELNVHPGVIAHTKNRAMDVEQDVRVKAHKAAAKKAKAKKE